MTNERIYFEINENTCIRDGNTLTFSIPYDLQSSEGIDFYFGGELAKESLILESVEIFPAPLERFWNWMSCAAGCCEYVCKPEVPHDVARYQTAGRMGSFGFSGHTNDGSDIIVTITIAEE